MKMEFVLIKSRVQVSDPTMEYRVILTLERGGSPGAPVSTEELVIDAQQVRDLVAWMDSVEAQGFKPFQMISPDPKPSIDDLDLSGGWGVPP